MEQQKQFHYNQRKNKQAGRGNRKKCDLCAYGAYDTDAGDLICEISMDQDEYTRYQVSDAKNCP